MNRSIINPLDPDKHMLVRDLDLFNYDKDEVQPLHTQIDAIWGELANEHMIVHFVQTGWPKVKFVDGKEVPVPEAEQKPAIVYKLFKDGVTPSPEVPDKTWKLFVWLELIEGEKGDPGVDGAKGDKGDRGEGLFINYVVDNVDGMLNNYPHHENEICYVAGSKELYISVGVPPTLPSTMDNWRLLPPVIGIKGDVGPRGPQGPRGQKGQSGGISDLVLNWVVSTATNQALTQVQLQFNNLEVQLENMVETAVVNAAESAVDKAIEDAWDELKGDDGAKGDKGDDGKDGKDGKACTIICSRDTLDELQRDYPAGDAHAGHGAIVGPESDLYMCLQDIPDGIFWRWRKVGNIQGPDGPKGADANWIISIEKGAEHPAEVVQIVSNGGDTPNFWMEGTDGIVIDRYMHSDAGISIKMKHPIPPVNAEDVGKYLCIKDVNTLEWADLIQTEIFLAAPLGPGETDADLVIFKLGVDKEGNLTTEKVTGG